MTLGEFLRSLEMRMNEELKLRANHPRFTSVGDGIVVHGQDPNEAGLIEGVWWTLGSSSDKHPLKIRFTRKAAIAWKCGDFERILPTKGDRDWFDLDEETSEVTLRLHLR